MPVIRQQKAMTYFMLSVLLLVVSAGMSSLHSQLVLLVKKQDEHLANQKEILEELKKLTDLKNRLNQ